jgi:hypothetical protein
LNERRPSSQPLETRSPDQPYSRNKLTRDIPMICRYM